jgi:hypothetical protein
LPTVAKNETTRRRWRRDWAEPLKMSVCFQRIPKSSSCTQMALRIVRGSPLSPVTVASR